MYAAIREHIAIRYSHNSKNAKVEKTKIMEAL